MQCISKTLHCDIGPLEPPANDAPSIRIEISTRATVAESQGEKRAFAFFRQRTAAHLAGLLENDFWDQFVLQVARSDDSIRHALVALAAVHEDYERGSSTTFPTNAFALRQYNRAIHGHIERVKSIDSITTSAVTSYLVCCALFICIEMLQEHFTSAISLIKQAVRLFYGLPIQRISAMSSSWSMHIFEALLGRLQFMAVGVIGRGSYSTTIPPRLRAATTSPIPDCFSSVRDAKEQLEFSIHTHELSRNPSSIGYIYDPTELADGERGNVITYHDLICRWSRSFDAWRHSREPKSPTNARERRTAVVLDIRRRFLTTLADFSTWDDHGDTFNEILDLIESISQEMRLIEPFAGSRDERLFTLEFGTVSPLFMIARGCRDPLLRRRAIGLLRRFPIREGLWDSKMAADTAEHVMVLEEQAAGVNVTSAQDIPQWARIREATTHRDYTDMEIRTVQSVD